MLDVGTGVGAATVGTGAPVETAPGVQAAVADTRAAIKTMNSFCFTVISFEFPPKIAVQFSSPSMGEERKGEGDENLILPKILPLSLILSPKGREDLSAICILQVFVAMSRGDSPGYETPGILCFKLRAVLQVLKTPMSYVVI